MSNCKDCLSYEVCGKQILTGWGDGDLQICGHFKDRNCFIEMPCEIKPKADYYLNRLGDDMFEAKRYVTYAWCESVVCDDKTHAQQKIDYWKSEESLLPFNRCIEE